MVSSHPNVPVADDPGSGRAAAVMVSFWIVLATAPSLAVPPAIAEAMQPATPNVIVILTDDQGTVDLRAAGAADLETPNLDALARRGVRFTQFYAAAPLCSPSRAGLLTGRHPIRAGMPDNASPQAGDPGMPASEITIAELLKPSRYATAHVGKWHLGYSPQTMPLGQGFDFSFGHMGGCIDNFSHFYYWSGANRHDLHRDGRETYRPGRFFGDLMVEEAAGFLERNRDRPFFLYFAINEPHFPCQPDVKWLAHYAHLKYPRNIYAAFLSTMDERIGRLMEKLDSLGLRERTIVIVQSDHGHSTEEWAHFGGGSAGPYRGAKYSLFEGGIRVPAIVSWPGRLPQNEVRDQMAYGCDWLPTIAELCGITPPNIALDGKSLVPVIRSADAPSPHDVLHWQIDSSWAVRAGDWKLLFDVVDTTQRAPGRKIAGTFLVNLRDDRSETTNLAARRPDVVARLRRLRADWEAGLPEEAGRTIQSSGLSEELPRPAAPAAVPRPRHR
jgi:arylsulfatase A-like enzyme